MGSAVETPRNVSMEQILGMVWGREALMDSGLKLTIISGAGSIKKGTLNLCRIEDNAQVTGLSVSEGPVD